MGVEEKAFLVAGEQKVVKVVVGAAAQRVVASV